MKRAVPIALSLVLFGGATRAYTAPPESAASVTTPSAGQGKARVLYSQAIEKYAATDFDAALQLLQVAIQQDPAHAESQHLYGVILLQTRRYEQAEAALRNVFAKGQFPQAFFELGLAQFRQKKFHEAEGSFVEATRVEPQRAAAFYMLGMSQYEQHDYTKSAENFRFSAQFSARDDVMRVASYFYRGEALLRAGDDNNARRAFASVLRDGPNTVFADIARRGGTLQGDSGEAGAYAALGVQYDSNPTLAGGNPAGVAAGRGFFDGGVRYVTPIAGPVDLGMGLAFFQSLHFAEPGRSVDLTAPQGNAELGFRFSDKAVQDRLSFGYTGGADFYQGFTSPTKKAINFFSAYHRPYARFELREGNDWYTSFAYTFRFEDFNTRVDPPPSGSTDPLNFRSFLGHEGRVAQHFLFPKRFGRASAAAHFRYEDAKGARWDAIGGGLALDGEFTPVKQVALRLAGYFTMFAYPGEDRVRDRRDTLLGAQFGVRYWFIENLGVHGDVGISKQWSGLPAFDYVRFIASFYLMARL